MSLLNLRLRCRGHLKRPIPFNLAHVKNRADLESIGFRDLASWQFQNEVLKHVGDNPDEWDARLDVQRALYAFVVEEEVCYIGKTAQNLKTRFAGYCSPGKDQQTNLRCNEKIKERLRSGKGVRILVFHDRGNLQWGDYRFDVAAGLENSLINAFEPPWNSGGRQKKISESEELERSVLPGGSEDGAKASEVQFTTTDPSKTFKVELGKTYYYSGFINVPKGLEVNLGDDREDVAICLGSEGDVIVSVINRTANQNGAVRICRNTKPIAAWYQKHFKVGDSVSISILSRNKLLLRLNGDRNGGSDQ